jgi:hypothetical protein
MISWFQFKPLLSNGSTCTAHYPSVAKKVRQPCVAVVTTSKVWNDFIKLRMDRVYKVGGCTSSNPVDP